MDIQKYINELEAKIANLEAEAADHHVEMRKIRKHNSDLKGQIKNQNLSALDATRDILRFLKQKTDLETELTNAQERYRRLFMASNAVAIEHDDGTTEIII